MQWFQQKPAKATAHVHQNLPKYIFQSLRNDYNAREKLPPICLTSSGAWRFCQVLGRGRTSKIVADEENSPETCLIYAKNVQASTSNDVTTP